MDNNESEKYEQTIISDKYHKINLSIEIKNSKLSFSCYYIEDYFKIKCFNEFSLEELKKNSNYFKQFNNEKEILEEIKHNNLKGQEKIFEDENSEKIRLVIPLPINIYKNVEFTLSKLKKTDQEILEEYKSIISNYKDKLLIKDLNSKIIIDTEQKEILKSFISYCDKLKAKLLYSFYNTYTNEEIANNLKKKKIPYSVRDFHAKCDNISSILVVCKSDEQIFGGYTPLSFKSDDSYKSDKNSFIFSLNRKEKYLKCLANFLDYSIWCYKDYGPCFSYDLEFIKGKINIVTFSKYNYDIPSPFFGDKDKCLKNKDNSSEFFLDSLEIFQIIKC
jgi:hypothetical protein